jgi:hypothetical protein
MPIEAMEKTPLLLPVQRIVSGVQVQDDFFWRLPMGLSRSTLRLLPRQPTLSVNRKP